MPHGLTRNMRDCLLIIQELTAASGGVAPSLEEIRVEMDMPGRTTVHQTVKRLRERGYVDHIPHASRSLRVLVPIAAPVEEPEFVGLFEDAALATEVTG